MLDTRSNMPILNCKGPKIVRSALLGLKPFFICSLAFIFLINSLGGDLLIREAWAAKASGLTSIGPETAGSPAPLKVLGVDTFSLPQEFGYVQESIKAPGSKKTVIHIQDAHCNYAAQKSISHLLNYITTEYGINAVNCEGGADSYDLSIFTSIPEKDVREKTSDYFVREGVVSAAEYFAVNNPQKVKLWGVEDPDLYIKNLKVYRDSLAHKEEVDRYLRSISYILDNLKRHIYSAELLEFDGYYARYKDGKISFKEYMIYIITAAQKRLINIKSFSNIYLLSQTLGEEDKIDFRKADNEKDEIVDKLKKTLSRNELAELMAKVGQLKAEQISQTDFYAYLVRKAKSIKLDISAYHELQKYRIYIAMYNAVDRTRIAKEMDALEYKIKEALYENDTQRELGILSKNLTLTKNIFNISLTRDDYAYYKAYRATFAASNYVSFINRIAPLYKIEVALDKNITILDHYREGMDQFYDLSLERDRAFIKNIKFTDHDRPNSIIITGGFHTENLRELFKNENISYISIMPKFKNEKGYESPYLKRLSGQRTALENVINTAIPAILNMQVVEILSRLGVMVEGSANIERFRLAVLIVAGINRTGNAILRLTAKDLNLPEQERQDDKIVLFTRGPGDSIEHQEFSPFNFNARTANAENADTILLNPQTFAFKSMGLPGHLQIAQVPAVPAPQGEERYVAPLNPPEDQVPVFFGNLFDNTGKRIEDTRGVVFDVLDKSVTLTPPDMSPIVVTLATDKSGNVITGKPDQLASSLGLLVRQPGLLNKEEAGKISVLIARLNLASKVIAIEDHEAVKAFFLGGTLYVNKNIVDNPALIVRAETKAEFSYEAAVEPAVGIASIVRKNTATRIISLVASEEDKNVVVNQGQIARKLMGPDVHINGYVAKDGWEKELRDILEIELKEFVKIDLERFAPLMEIRIKEGKEVRNMVEQMIDNILIEQGYQDRIKTIKDRMRLVQVHIEAGKRTNPAIEFFADIGMLECDRYRIGDYGDENRIPPKDLENHFLSLLNLSVKNGTDFDNKSIDEILRMIFSGHLLEIRPVDFKSFEEWKKANQMLLQSV